MTRDGQRAALVAMISPIHGMEAAERLVPKIEQLIIDAYLAEVPLPEGWTENAGAWGIVAYFDDELNERVIVGDGGFSIASKPAHWPAIPLPVLIRAAVQCHRLREGK